MMLSKMMKSGLIVILVMFLINGCSVKEIRSPIVFRSPVVLEKQTEPQEPVEKPAPPSLQKETVVVQEPEAGAPPTPFSPASIPILSDQELVEYNISILGRVKMESSSEQGYPREKAIQDLKVEAFKRYGSLAQGITNIEYKKGGSLSSMEQDNYREVSGDVVMLSKKSAVAEKETKPVPPGSGVSGKELAKAEAREAFPIDKIKILSSDELFNLSFKILGKVSVRNRRTGFTQEEAIKALKIEAYRMYRSKAQGLTKINLSKKEKVFYYTKVRRNITTPEEPKNYEKASAEVVFWGPES